MGAVVIVAMAVIMAVAVMMVVPMVVIMTVTMVMIVVMVMVMVMIILRVIFLLVKALVRIESFTLSHALIRVRLHSKLLLQTGILFDQRCQVSFDRRKVVEGFSEHRQIWWEIGELLREAVLHNGQDICTVTRICVRQLLTWCAS